MFWRNSVHNRDLGQSTSVRRLTTPVSRFPTHVPSVITFVRSRPSSSSVTQEDQLTFVKSLSVWTQTQTWEDEETTNLHPFNKRERFWVKGEYKLPILSSRIKSNILIYFITNILTIVSGILNTVNYEGSNSNNYFTRVPNLTCLDVSTGTPVLTGHQFMDLRRPAHWSTFRTKMYMTDPITLSMDLSAEISPLV